MRHEPVGLALDQRRTLAGPRPLVRRLHRPVAREDVVAVDHDPGEPVALGAARDVLHRHLREQPVRDQRSRVEAGCRKALQAAREGYGFPGIEGDGNDVLESYRR